MKNAAHQIDDLIKRYGAEMQRQEFSLRFWTFAGRAFPFAVLIAAVFLAAV